MRVWLAREPLDKALYLYGNYVIYYTKPTVRNGEICDVKSGQWDLFECKDHFIEEIFGIKLKPGEGPIEIELKGERVWPWLKEIEIDHESTE